MEWMSEQELNALDAFARGIDGDGLAFLATVEGALALCRAYPRVSHELRAQRQAVKRLEQGLARTSRTEAQLRAENQMLHDRVAAATVLTAGLAPPSPWPRLECWLVSVAPTYAHRRWRARRARALERKTTDLPRPCAPSPYTTRVHR
jgi:hypothetical protein